MTMTRVLTNLRTFVLYVFVLSSIGEKNDISPELTPLSGGCVTREREEPSEQTRFFGSVCVANYLERLKQVQALRLELLMFRATCVGVWSSRERRPSCMKT